MNFINSQIIKEDSEYFIKGEGIKLQIPEKFNCRITDYTGKKVIFGVRPENIHDKRFVSSASLYSTMKTKVEVIEPLGAEIYIYLACGGNSLVGKMDSRTHAEVDHDMEILIDMEKIHIFDADTKLAIV